MRKRNGVAQLNKRKSHRDAMLRNMATSLFEHERIVTTRAKSKVLRSYAEKLITRAKQNLVSDAAPENQLHNKREVMSVIRDRGIVVKLFEDIAPRYKEREGGYTRIIHLPARKSDSAPMSIIELVDRKEKIRKIKTDADKKARGDSSDKGEKKETRTDSTSGDNKGKWYDRFRRKKKQREHN
ncbi:MAG: 50S ribosomal protein L17 [Leptospiraceae bacterium]|nr:50S ribosomal protein L17 [Leptospiraceae bacterium]